MGKKQKTIIKIIYLSWKKKNLVPFLCMTDKNKSLPKLKIVNNYNREIDKLKNQFDKSYRAGVKDHLSRLGEKQNMGFRK